MPDDERIPQIDPYGGPDEGGETADLEGVPSWLRDQVIPNMNRNEQLETNTTDEEIEAATKRLAEKEAGG